MPQFASPDGRDIQCKMATWMPDPPHPHPSGPSTVYSSFCYSDLIGDEGLMLVYINTGREHQEYPPLYKYTTVKVYTNQ